MRLNKLVGSAATHLEAITRLFTWVGIGGSTLMTLIIVCNVLGRFLFKRPLLGTGELVEALLVIVVFSSLAYTEARRGHVHVELVVSRLPKPAQATLAGIMSFLCGVFFLIMAWQAGKLAVFYLSPTVESPLLSIPHSALMLIIALGSVVLALEMLAHISHPLPPGEG